jgi:hypothetical protein
VHLALARAQETGRSARVRALALALSLALWR